MFQAGKPVTGTDFIGRKVEVELIKEYMAIGQSVAIIAPRRFGKTSLVQEVIKQKDDKRVYTGFVDVFACPDILTLAQEITAAVLDNHKLKETFRRLKSSATQMLKNIELKSVIEDFEFIIGYADQHTLPMEHLTKSIKFIDAFAERHDKSMIFAMDEIGDLSKYPNDKDIIKLLRSEIQNQNAATYMFSGSYESTMDAMFVNDKSPFYRMVRIVKLGYLPFGEVKKYMSLKLKKFDVDIGDKELEDIIDFLKGHPYYCQLALQQIYLYRRLKKRIPSLEELLDELLAVENSYLERLWEDYSGSTELSFTLRNLINEPVGIYKKTKSSRINPARALARLEGQGILYKKDKGYYFYDPMFEYYLSRMFGAS